MVSCEPLDEGKRSVCQDPEPGRDRDEQAASTDGLGGHVRHRGIAGTQPSAAAAQNWQWTLDFIRTAIGNALIILACAGVGLLIVSRRPDNLIGWIYALAALLFAAGEFASSYTSRPLPGRTWTALFPDIAWIVAIPFEPDAAAVAVSHRSAPSPRWWPVVWAVVVATVLAVVASALKPGPMNYLPVLTIPWAWSRPNGYAT